MNNKALRIALVGAALFALPMPAMAAVTLRTFEFTATNFAGSPIRSDSPTTIKGQFSVLYNPAFNTGFNDTVGVQSFSVDTAHPSLAFAPSALRYQNRPGVHPGLATSETLVIGRATGRALGDDVTTVYYEEVDFAITVQRIDFIDPAIADLNYDGLCYAQTNLAGVICTQQGGFTIAEVSGVPAPATWLMMTLGFGVIGARLRRHRVATIRAA